MTFERQQIFRMRDSKQPRFGTQGREKKKSWEIAPTLITAASESGWSALNEVSFDLILVIMILSRQQYNFPPPLALIRILLW